MENYHVVILVILVFVIIYYYQSSKTKNSKFEPSPVIPLYNLSGGPNLEYDTGGAFNIGNQAKVYYST